MLPHGKLHIKEKIKYKNIGDQTKRILKNIQNTFPKRSKQNEN